MSNRGVPAGNRLAAYNLETPQGTKTCARPEIGLSRSAPPAGFLEQLQKLDEAKTGDLVNVGPL